MPVIPKELLLFSQTCGALPLTCSKTSQNNGSSLQFSRVLYAKNVVVITLLTVLSIVSLWVDYDAYLRGEPLRMVHATNVVAVFLDVAFLNAMSAAVFASNLRKYGEFVDLCHILERIDRALGLTTDDRPWVFRVWLVGLYITSIIVNTEARLSSVGWKGVWHLFDLLHYYVQGALFLQFTFVVHSFTGRLRSINKLIKREVVERSQRRPQHVMSPPDPGIINQYKKSTNIIIICLVRHRRNQGSYMKVR